MIEPAAPLLWPGRHRQLREPAVDRGLDGRRGGGSAWGSVSTRRGRRGRGRRAEGVGLAEALVVGLLDGAPSFEEDEQPATARLRPAARTTAAGRVSARFCFTLFGYRAFMSGGRRHAIVRLSISDGDHSPAASARPLEQRSSYRRAVDTRHAGEFGTWLSDFQVSLGERASVDVPCAGCTACCRSGKLIPVEADEADALAHIPAGVFGRRCRVIAPDAS